MIRAQIIDRWIGDGLSAASPFRYALIDSVACSSTESFADVTGQPLANLPTSPNLLVVECIVNDATFAAILAHPDYGPGAVLWSETL